MESRLLRLTVVVSLLFAKTFLLGFSAKPQGQTPRSRQSKSGVPDGGAKVEICHKSGGAAKVVHAYHKEPPTGPLSATINPGPFMYDKAAFVAYSIAAKIRELLYQEPCYCPCDKEEGHSSLLDCYTSVHATKCPVCQMGVVFVYEESKIGRTAAEIREAMEKGDAWKIDVNKYTEAHYADYKQPLP
jgi:uncharacterized protein with PCYCGC motif